MPISDFDRQLLSPILRREGGWVFTDDPDDLGGACYGGCTLRTFNDWRKRSAGVEAIAEHEFRRRALAGEEGLRDQIMQCYTERFIRPFDWISPVALRAAVIDAAVNCGNLNATRFLQGAANTDRDGIIGPITKQMVTRAVKRPNGVLTVALRLTQARIEHYCLLCERRPSQVKFLKGWCRRAAEVLEEAAG